MCGPRRTVLQTLLHVASQLLWVRQSSLVFAQPYIALPAFFAFASSGFLAVSACLGSWLSVRDLKCLQGLFVYLLVVVLILESTAAALAYFHSTQVDSGMAPLTGGIQNYTGSSQDPNLELWMPLKRCCNAVVSLLQLYFPLLQWHCDLPWQLYTQGCQVKLGMTLRFVLRTIMWSWAFVVLVEVVLLGIVTQLMRTQPSIKYQLLEEN
ncbi:hypothetical protein Q5P01_020699 [Channa striata]|uniref:Uncharacterized protein n=1 Tax=Channa striata TaxID=64152 RepID=A0AA88M0F9_CHASR|nr:hypothetical protein Q5P01_020699 [Channa striata]